MTPDAELLDAYAATRADAAFAELVRRYGPLVEGACRRVLAGHADADDAYQATFLVLARRANEVRDPDRLGAWLHGVAVRCAKRARERTVARRETPLAVELPARPECDDWGDARALLDVELARLPAHYRAALVLCELQGVGRAEAARRLGVPEGTVSSRLARGKARLRARLVTRGVTLTSAAVAGLLGEASAVGAAKPVASPPSAAAVALFQMEVPAMTGSLIGKLALALLTALGLSAAGLWLAAPPAAKPDAPLPVDPAEVADLKAMQGEWRILKHTVEGPDTRRDEPGQKSMTFVGNTFAIDGRASKAPFVIYPNESPRQIDAMIPPEGSENKFDYKMEGIYRLEDGNLILSFGYTVVNKRLRPVRPKDFTQNLAGRALMVDTYVLCRPESVATNKPRPLIDPAVEKKAIQGRWKLVSTRGGYQGVPEPKGTEIMELTADRVTSPEGPVSRYVIYPNENPPQIDTTFVMDEETSARGKIEGIYRLDGDTLTIHWRFPSGNGHQQSRPTGFTPTPIEPGHETSVQTYQRVRNEQPRE